MIQDFPDDFGRDVGAAIVQTPEGPRLCCVGDSGYVLYAPNEWAHTCPAELEADADGHVTRLGRYVDYDAPEWIVPESIRVNAIS